MTYRQLVEGQRYQIQAYLSQDLSQRAIARLLKVNPSNISRELDRNTMDDQYCPEQAHKHMRSRKRNAAKYRISSTTELYVRSLIELDWSPEQTAGVLTMLGSPVSHEWIYQ